MVTSSHAPRFARPLAPCPLCAGGLRQLTRSQSRGARRERCGLLLWGNACLPWRSLSPGCASAEGPSGALYRPERTAFRRASLSRSFTVVLTFSIPLSLLALTTASPTPRPPSAGQRPGQGAPVLRARQGPPPQPRRVQRVPQVPPHLQPGHHLQDGAQRARLRRPREVPGPPLGANWVPGRVVSACAPARCRSAGPLPGNLRGGRWARCG